MRLGAARLIVFSVMLVILQARSLRAEHYDVFLLGGQSNAQGHGYYDNAHAQWTPGSNDTGLVELGLLQYAQPQANVSLYMRRGAVPISNRQATWNYQTAGIIPNKGGYDMYGYNLSNPSQLGTLLEKHAFGPEVTFGTRMSELLPGRKILIIKYTEGGTSLAVDWDPAAGRTYANASLAAAGHDYAGFMETVTVSLNNLTAAGNTYDLRGMLWHQGESDSSSSTATYANRLTNFISSVRQDLNAPNLPFAIGELIQPRTSYNNVRAAQLQVANADPYSVFVSSLGLTPDSSAIHFDTASQLEFGERFANEMITIVPQAPGDADRNAILDADDYFRIDQGYSRGLSGWENGDFNFDGTINGDDYYILDNAYAAAASVNVTSGSMTAMVSLVPEPSGAVLVLAAAVVLQRRPHCR